VRRIEGQSDTPEAGSVGEKKGTELRELRVNGDEVDAFDRSGIWN
jgi:hypothetical protein